ncbi:MAG: monovalent cation:proton antiporter family protein [Acidobacteriota bacterium]
MGHLTILHDLILVYALGALVVYVFHRIGQSALVGFLVTGLIVGPNFLGLVSDPAVVRELAELGVMLLLFSVGLEFSLQKLRQMKRIVFVTGPLQVGLTIAVAAALGWAFSLPGSLFLVLGLCGALSSTAMVVKILLDRGEIDALHGRYALGILIFQDLSVVVMILLLPQLAAPSSAWPQILTELALAAGFLAALFLLARYVYPAVLDHVVRVRSKELFVIASLVLFLGTAYAAAGAGFSLALGAFLAGLVISGSEYSHIVFSEIRPLRDSLNSLFFISIGMLVDPAFVLQQWQVVAAVLVLLLLGKTLATTLAAAVTGVPVSVAVTVGFGLAQIGEFSFVLLDSALQHPGLLPFDWYQILLTTAVLSLLLSPLLMATGRRVALLSLLEHFRPLVSRQESHLELSEAGEATGDHVIICGFGVSGRSIAKVLRAHGVPYVILELNIQTVKEERRKDEPIFYADATNDEALERAGIKTARAIVYALSDPFALRRAIPAARALNPNLLILTRTKWLADIDELYRLGANEVVAEEFEASIELLTRILRVYNFPRELVAAEVRRIREERYSVFRSERATVPRLRLSKELDVYVETVVVPENSPLRDRTIGETRFRSVTGSLILGIVRNGTALNNPGGEERILVGDMLVLSGTKEQLRRALELLRPGEPAAVPPSEPLASL